MKQLSNEDLLISSIKKRIKDNQVGGIIIGIFGIIVLYISLSSLNTFLLILSVLLIFLGADSFNTAGTLRNRLLIISPKYRNEYSEEMVQELLDGNT